ncbi:AP-5 complex subunit sigma-1 isoform X1 [Hydra vulgaris]|uniref:AP-5 complex subunit sigma-1 isoform X1 n=1 Tax=Hydra vulgaris TaxID=6087 RepID=UPI0006414874|nr:AP-5 complex subunit sigma-1 [Hydra vulgaris]
MVLVFIVHALFCNEASNRGSTLKYWEAYAPLTKNIDDNCRNIEHENLVSIINRVNSEYSFRRDVANNKELIDQGTETGIFRLKNSLIPNVHSVLWKSSNGYAFVFVMVAGENITSAVDILGLIVKYSLSIFNMAENQDSQLLQYPEKMVALLHVFLPAGQLLFLNHRLIKQLERDLNKILSDKK